MQESTKQVGDKIVEKFKQDVAELSVEETLKRYEALKLQLSKARIPIPREIRQLMTQKLHRKS